MAAGRTGSPTPTTLVEQVLAEHTEFDAVTQLAAAFPLRVFPDAVGIGQSGRENLLPYGDLAFNSFGPSNDLVARAATRAGRAVGLGRSRMCARDRLSDSGFGAQIWAAADRGDITYEQAPLIVRSLLTAGVDTTVNGSRRCCTRSPPTPISGQRLRANPSLARTAFDEAVRWESPVQTFFRTATRDVEIGGTLIPDGQDPDVPRRREPRSASLGRTPTPSTFAATRPATSGSAWASTSASVNTSPDSRPRLCSPLSQRRVETIEIAGPVRRHLNNTLRSWNRSRSGFGRRRRGCEQTTTAAASRRETAAVASESGISPAPSPSANRTRPG